MKVKMPKWDSELHSEVEQVKRILAVPDVISGVISRNKEKAIIQGSDPKPYTVTYTECECSDFKKRKKPCKHMYALAFLNDLIDVPDMTRSKNTAKNTFKEDIAKYIEMYEKGELLPDSYVKIVSALQKAK